MSLSGSSTSVSLGQNDQDRIHFPNQDSEQAARSPSDESTVTVVGSGSPRPARSTARSFVLIASCTGAMMVFIGSTTAVSMALPSIGQDLNIPEARLQWLVSAFSLSSGCLLLLLGRLADLYGRKLVFLLGCVVQAAFSLGCGFANTEISINILRGFQGCGAAATIPASLGILADTFPPSRMRSIAFTIFAAGAPIGAALGNSTGAILTQLSEPKWRSVFYLITGFNLLCFAGGLFSMDMDCGSTEKDRRVDYIGAFLITSGMTFVIFVLSDGSIARNGWSTSYIIALLIAGITLIFVFLIWQWYLELAQARYDREDSKEQRLPPPIMKLSMWRRANGRYAVMQCIAFLNWSSFNSYLFWVQLYYQKYLGLSPVLTMVRLLPNLVVGLICLLAVALVIGRLDIVYFMVFGTLSTAFANVFFALANPSDSYWAYGFPSAIMSVIGADFAFSGGTLFIAKISLPHEQSVGGALFQTMTQLGTSFGLSITTIIFDRVQYDWTKKLGVASGDEVPREALLHAYHAAEWGSFAFGILATILAAVFLRGTGIIGDEEENDSSPSRSSSV